MPAQINIIFDADDTLWETEPLYDRARKKFADLMVEANLGSENEVIRRAKEIDLEMFKEFGYS
jgi:FMN phosphatase YigB (HAD superfamily)